MDYHEYVTPRAIARDRYAFTRAAVEWLYYVWAPWTDLGRAALSARLGSYKRGKLRDPWTGEESPTWPLAEGKIVEIAWARFLGASFSLENAANTFDLHVNGVNIEVKASAHVNLQNLEYAKPHFVAFGTFDPKDLSVHLRGYASYDTVRACSVETGRMMRGNTRADYVSVPNEVLCRVA